MSSMNSMRLRELIRSVRACKTASEERALVNKECATIREEFKAATPYLRIRGMLKLLYVSMLGYPTEFGQLEVINLLAQADFSGKRIGYLALQLILDESDEVLTLAENHMKNDMGSGNPLMQSIALNAAANIASEDMARDVFDEVMKLVASSNPYIKKKACLTAVRIVRKVPEHAEYFLEKFTDVFADRHSGSLLCSITLINECLMTEYGAPFLNDYRKLALPAIRILKSLVLSVRVTEQDVGGITDPFLQVKLLQFMRLIGEDSVATSEALNDVLAQVITNTDSSKNVGCSVQYECVRTIDAIKSDSGLRALGIGAITRFLGSSRDNNLRFVALQTLLHSTTSNLARVQRHQDVVFECLKDPDVSIRHRALELTVALVTEANVRLLVPDLLAYLAVCAESMQGLVTHHICQTIENKSPSDEWRVELSLKLLIQARHHTSLDFATRLIGVISNQSAAVQARAVQVLWTEASFPFDALHQARKAFLVVALWCLGEYAEMLVSSSSATWEEVLGCLNDITTNSTYGIVKRYGLTALMKFYTAFPESKNVVLTVFRNNMTSMDCELQQRACEYGALVKNYPEEAQFSFSQMPPINVEGDDVKPVQIVSVTPEALKKQTANTLDDLFNFDSVPDQQASYSPATGPIQSSYEDGSMSMGPAPVTGSTPQQYENSNVDLMDSLFGGGAPSPAAPLPQHVDPFAPMSGPLGSVPGSDAM